MRTDLHPIYDRVRLPDEWGYDYRTPRFMSPYMRRSLLLALSPFAVVLLVIALVAFL